MAAQILTAAGDLEQVRKALDASLSVDELPDSTIQLAFYLDVGEAMVTQQVPAWNALGTVDKVYFKAATVAQVAALLAPAMVNILPKSEEAITYKVTREPVDWDKKAATLRQLVIDNLGRISTRPLAGMPALMNVSGPTRKAAATGQGSFR